MGDQGVNNTILVDTDILIDAALNISVAVHCLEQIERHSSLAISIITQMELLIGCRNKTELRKMERFFKAFPNDQTE